MKNTKPIQFFIRTISYIFISEAIVMFFLSKLPSLSLYVEAFFDAFMLSVIVLPLLYFTLFKPMRNYIVEKDKVEEQLAIKNRELIEKQKLLIEKTKIAEESKTTAQEEKIKAENAREFAEKQEAETRKQAEELKKMNQFMIDREHRMVELKKEINDLLKDLGKEPKYNIIN
jgi:hypothetical protein